MHLHFSTAHSYIHTYALATKESPGPKLSEPRVSPGPQSSDPQSEALRYFDRLFIRASIKPAIIRSKIFSFV